MKKVRKSLFIVLLILVGVGASAQRDYESLADKLLKKRKPDRSPVSPSATKKETREEEKTWEFIAIGKSALSPGKDHLRARDEAIRSALRNAIEQGVGLSLGSLTLVRDYQTQLDVIFTHSRGYVKTYRVIDEYEEDGVLVVKIRAEVGMDKLQADLLSVETFKKLLNYPRIMIVGRESIDGKPIRGSRLVQTAMENILLQSGYDLVDVEQLERIKERDTLLAESEEERLSLGRRFGADCIISYEADARFAGRDRIYGMDFYFYNAVVNARVFNTDTGRVFVSESVRLRRSSEARDSASQSALHFAGKEMGERLKDKILHAWASQSLDRGLWIELKLKGVDYKSALQIAREMRKWRHILDVKSPTFIKGIAIYQVRVLMTASALAERLSELKSLEISIDEVLQNSINAHIQRKRTEKTDP